MLDELVTVFGGTVRLAHGQTQTQRTTWKWEVGGRRARAAAARLLPLLKIKRAGAEALLASNPDETKRLNRRGPIGQLRLDSFSKVSVERYGWH